MGVKFLLTLSTLLFVASSVTSFDDVKATNTDESEKVIIKVTTFPNLNFSFVTV